MTIEQIPENVIKEIIYKYSFGNYNMKMLSKEYNISILFIKKALQNNKIEVRRSGTPRLYKVNDYYFDEIDSEEKAYFLGFLYADGSISKDMNCVSMNLQVGDKEILQKLNDLVQPERPLWFRNNQRVRDGETRRGTKDQFCMSIRSKRIPQMLEKWGCAHNKTYKHMEFPSFLSSELIPHFIRGFLDGDGCIYKGLVSFTGRFEFLKGLKAITEKEIELIGDIRNYYPISNEFGRFIFSGKKRSLQFLNWIYKDATIYMERKFQKYLEAKNITKLNN